MSSQPTINNVLPKVITTPDKIDATTKGTDENISTLRDSVDELGRTAGDLESTNNMMHDSLTRQKRNVNRIDTRLRRIEGELLKKKQKQQEAERRLKSVQESKDREEREERERVALRVLGSNPSEERIRRILVQAAKILIERHGGF
ncbi:hypothetical protein FPANT_5982 [Fusarium pseudoanthophilum]|uniref:Uncharacterized protein n=1 Tax=Fusarium pseudoanthophilum TaxID=48495 RepID=A0A8H5LCR9_9HYPO|nr:hypothetical protein FPANT_5982 [Fusarium pseudoanthophilum]